MITRYSYDALEAEVNKIVDAYKANAIAKGKDPESTTGRRRMERLPMHRLIHEHIYSRTGIRTRINYGVDLQLKTVRETYDATPVPTEIVVTDEGSFERKIITPHDILRGDKSILNYDEEKAKEDEWKKGLLPKFDKLEDAEKVYHYAEGTTLLPTPPEVIELMGDKFDVILPRNFRPTLPLNWTLPDGRKSAVVSHTVLDEIIKLGPLWKLAVSTSFYRNDLYSLIHYIQRDGMVIVRESRNCDYIILY